MKKNALQREFKKLKSQINQISEIVHNSKQGTMIEHEATIRKKLKLLYEMEKEHFKEYDSTVEEYEEILEYVCKKILEDYNKKNDTEFDYYDVVRSRWKGLLNSGILPLLINQHIPKLVSKEFDETFPSNPKDEYIRARAMKRKIYVHLGDTNTGKTYNAMERLKTAKKGMYLSPLRILALENYERLLNMGIKCDLSTGEEEILTEGATHISCTVEKANIKDIFDIIVLDEIQMINDKDRGSAWSRALLGVRAGEIHLCGAMNSKELLVKILNDCKDDYEIIEYERKIPLEIQYKNFNNRDAEEGDALVVFSKKRVLQLAEEYSTMGIKASIIYGDLPPEVRRKQYDQFINKENKILITTDAIGMGVNLPIKRIVFLGTKKFDGDEVRYLTSQEVKQIAGRAGRIGIYDIGYVAGVNNSCNFLKEKIDENDDIIKSAVIGPSEAILKIQHIPLKQKLSLWSAREEKLSYYRKMDINEYLIILEKVKSYKLKEKTQWELLKVPFDISKDNLMECFLNYVEELFVRKEKNITKPQCYSGYLDELEIYYQKISMYYSFNKIFNLECDMEWIKGERLRVSDEINEILIGI